MLHSLCRLRSPFIRLRRWMAAGLLGFHLAVALAAHGMDFRDNAAMHSQKGIAWLENNQPANAVGEFLIALRLNPHTVLSASLYNNLGLAYRQLGQYPLALASFQRAIRLQPGFVLYYQNLVQTYVVAGTLATARQVVADIVGMNPRDAEAWFLLGLIHRYEGNAPAARRAFQHFVQLAPNSPLVDTALEHSG